MEIIKGKKTYEIGGDEFREIASRFGSVMADLGCGDGKYVYEMAKKHPDTLHIGVDADRNNLVRYSAKIRRKREKGGLDNVIYVIANVEDLPPEIENSVDRIRILLPWGSLLKGIVNADPRYLENIVMIASDGASIIIHVNYDLKYEPVEMERLGLPEITERFVEEELVPKFNEYGITEIRHDFLDNREVRKIPSRWTRKLSFGRSRKTLEITGKILKEAEN